MQVDVLLFWRGMRERTPQLADIACRYLSVPVNSVDAERSFSAYNIVLSDKRHNLSDDSTKMLVSMYFNAGMNNDLD